EDTGTDTTVEDTGTDTTVEDTATDTTVEDTGGGSGDTTIEDTNGSGDTTGPSGVLVFGDDYGPGVSFAPFGGSNNAVSIDTAEFAAGSASFRIDVPAGGYTGGALVAGRPASLVDFNAVTFWAKASRPATLNTVGFGNDSADNYLQTEERNVALGTEWVKFTLPIVAADRLTAVAGLFHFAEGSDEGAYTIWLDEISYETLDTIGAASGSFGTAALDLTVAQTARANGLVATVDVAGAPITIFPAAPFFDWISSNTAAATVDGSGLVTAVGGGSATITATLEGAAVGGSLSITVVDGPATAAPTPTTPAGDVIASIYSGAYPAAPVDTFRTPWSAAVQSNETIAGDETLVYSSLDFVGIEFTGANSIDATAAEFVHFDIWSPNATGFGVKLVDFGADNGYDGGDDSQAQIDLSSASTPPLTTSGWVSYDLPLSAFVSAGLTNRAHLSQLILVGRVDGVPGVASAYIDNFYFYRGDVPPAPTAPTSAAPIPLTPEAAVVASLFSDAYPAAPVDTFRTSWSASGQSNELIAGDNTLLYSGLDFAGVEFVGANAIDATAATHVHFDIWTANATEFGFKLVDFGADNGFDGGDDSNAQLDFTASSTPALTTGSWVSFDIALDDFVAAGLANRAHLSQLVLVGRVDGTPGLANVYLDNIYFYEDVPSASRTIFGDDYGTDIAFSGFGGSTNNVSVDTTVAASGTASLRVDVPAGGYTGGALTALTPIDLSAFNALTFRVKADRAVTLNTAGIGNDTDDTTFQIETRNLAVGTEWIEYTIPLLDSSKLTSVLGLFHFAEGSDEGAYTLWFDEIRYTDDTSVGAPSGAFGNTTTNLEVARTTSAVGLVASVVTRGGTVTVYPAASYCDWNSSNTGVATVSSSGIVTGVAAGTATITATLGGASVGGALNITVVSGPGRAAPVPTTESRSVIASIYSDVYTANTVDTFRTDWSAASQTTAVISGDNALVYGNLDFAGVEFTGANAIDASAATYIHFDIWTANATEFGLKLVDFGADGAYDGGDDTNAQLDFTAGSTPALTTGVWVSYDVPLADFASAGLTNRASLQQMVVVGRVSGVPGLATIYLDNIYFY
ncbi:MAG: Ig-like domain-containing protein, partial [Deltaproteobacteria bacterium]|nr:Ig-like domain-containing protein [Deltaproteobacteria bacterium]